MQARYSMHPFCHAQFTWVSVNGPEKDSGFFALTRTEFQGIKCKAFQSLSPLWILCWPWKGPGVYDITAADMTNESMTRNMLHVSQKKVRWGLQLRSYAGFLDVKLSKPRCNNFFVNVSVRGAIVRHACLQTDTKVTLPFEVHVDAPE